MVRQPREPSTLPQRAAALQPARTLDCNLLSAGGMASAAPLRSRLAARTQSTVRSVDGGRARSFLRVAAQLMRIKHELAARRRNQYRDRKEARGV